MAAAIEGKSPERGVTSASAGELSAGELSACEISASKVSAGEIESDHRPVKVWAVLLWLIVTLPFLWGILMTLLEVRNLFR